MSDDLVKQSIAELQDIVRCRCHHAYKDRGMHDPDCDCDSADAVQEVADRIVELEADLRKMALDYLAAQGQAAEAYQAQLKAEAELATCEKYKAAYAECDRIGTQAVRDLEAKLNKAIGALEKVQAFVRDLEPHADQGHTLVPALRESCEILAELKGETDA